jgi:hypothetical protein
MSIASRYFRYKKREYLREKIKELAMNIKNKNVRLLYRGLNEFKRNNLVKDENGELLADSHNILKQVELLFSVIECA